MKKTDKKHHIDYEPFEAGFNGKGSNPLFEPVPNFSERPGDYSIGPTINNNTIIVFGRDRDPFRENKDGKKEAAGKGLFDIETVSGYSDHMGAGAIDIIVGRGAPYPLEGVKNYPNYLPPLYLTKNLSEVLEPDSTAGDGGGEVKTTLRDGNPHPGYVMDAARIYISQMCDIDDYFALHKPVLIDVDQSPCSAIILKSDRVRMHARRDIKIIAGGDKNTQSDSNGFQIKEGGKIHLIAGNGNLGFQQPIPVGYDLASCLEQMLKSISSALTLLDNFMTTQIDFNASVAAHFHGDPANGAVVQNACLQSLNKIANVSNTQDQLQITTAKINTTNIISNYLRHGGPNYINSRHNTTT